MEDQHNKQQEGNQPGQRPERPGAQLPPEQHNTYQAPPQGSYYRQGSWQRPDEQNRPQQPGQEYPGQQYSPGQRPQGAYQHNPQMPPNWQVPPPKQRKGGRVFPVLLAILLTFGFTFSGTWLLSVFGVLPGTEVTPEEINLEEGVELGEFGLSLHSDDPKLQDKAEKLAQVIDLLENQYYQVLSGEEIIEGMTEGLLDSVESPYTYYLDPEAYANYVSSAKGEYSGIGATVTQTDNGQFEIVAVVEGGPADEASIVRGDIITSVNGKDISEYKDTTALVEDVRGEQGTEVTLGIRSGSEEKTLVLVRDTVKVILTRSKMLTDNIGYLQVAEFSQNLPEEFKLQVEKLMSEGAEHIVFDMRNNPGGAASAVIECVDMLIGEGVIASIRGREDGEAFEEVWTSDAEKIVPDTMQFAILLNESSASAAELFSGSLRDHGKAVLIGKQTFGKGSGTRMYTLPDGSGANITIFNYYLPNGELIEGIGLSPDIEAEPPAEELRTTPLYELEPEQDPALQAALDYLRDE